MHSRSGWLASAAFGTCLLLAACGGRDQPATGFAPPDYSYLRKLRLNVGTLTIEDHATQADGSQGGSSGGNDLGLTAPVPPDQALQQMAHDRLIASGNSGTAIFTIDQASITGTGGGTLDGQMKVHLDIIAGNGSHAGYAEARVSRTVVPGTEAGDGGTRTRLYDLTQQMMQDMNVELEYQVQRSLRDWLVDASGAPVAGSVDQQPLAPPGSSMPGPAAPGIITPSPSNSGIISSGPSSSGSGSSGPGDSGTGMMGTSNTGATSVGTTPTGAIPLAPDASSSSPVMPTPPVAPPASPLPPVATPAPQASAPVMAPPTRSPPPGFLQPPASAAAPVPPTGTGY